MSDDDFELALVDGNRSSILRSYAKNLETKIQQIEELRHTPIVELLEKFKIATSDSDLDVRAVL
jgi:hypothetical protein